MIKLTEVSGDGGKFKAPIWIPTDVVIRNNGIGMAQIKMQNIPGHITVEESPEEVVRKIMDYKLSMTYYISTYDPVGEAVKRMLKLAGLEQTP